VIGGPRPGGDCPSEEDLLAHLSAVGAGAPGILDHIDRCAACRMLVAEASRALAQDKGLRSLPRGQHTLAPGEKVLERYEVRRFIARGGMGEVYEAFDPLLDEIVALKTLAPTVLDDDRAALRFKEEARLARRVSHPNVCRILEFGLHLRRTATGEPESIPFLTMEFLSGETLAARIARRGRYLTDEALPLVRQIAAGLRAIHYAGIIHRDLKSENVFLVADPRGGERVVLMDFGLARAVGGSLLTTWPQLPPGIAGTVDCMAPEQIQGARVGPAADIYAMGVLLFELLGGRRPFVRVAPSVRLLNEAPRLSTVSPGVARPWERAVATCLERRPEDRFPSIDGLLGALTSGAAPPRRRGRLAATVVALLAATALAWWLVRTGAADRLGR
jgi:serine/threonine protein kinase